MSKVSSHMPVPGTLPATSNGSTHLPCPPSYDEAIGYSSPSLAPPTPSHTLLEQYHPASEDFIKIDHADPSDLEINQDMDEEQDYEETRPLKMGRIPNTRAQYTFIQPFDTIQAGKKKKNSCNSGTPLGVDNRFPFPHHPLFPQAKSVPHHHHHLHHNGNQNPYAPAPGGDRMQYLFPNSNPALNTPSAPPVSYAPPSVPPPSTEGPQNTKDHIIPSGSSSATPAIVYAPPPFPPPPLMTEEVPLAGVPSFPSLMNPQDISIAEFKRSYNGVESCDPVLGDPYQLYRFFVAHNDRPSLHIVIRGHHIDKKESYETDSDGNRKMVVRDVEVEDFKIDIDLTEYIIPRGALFTAPDPKTGITPTIKEVLEDFADEENPFKEMQMHKSVVWDFEELRRAIVHAIRSVNYRHSIDVVYPISNDVVTVCSASQLANFMRSNWTKFFCFITFVGVIFYPAREIYKKVKDKTLKSEFQMSISTREFYSRYYWSIVDQVQYR
ncbi:hypothetical protein FBU30_006417 [Linnemannia zychae]|nr:hypothetical protein FBU30_006417 [Linnemannia zychae]